MSTNANTRISGEAWLLNMKRRQNHREALCFAQSEVKCATHVRRNFTMRSIASRTEGALICRKAQLVKNAKPK